MLGIFRVTTLVYRLLTGQQTICYFGLRMGKMVSICAAGRHVKHRVCFLLTMKMFKSHFHFQNTIKPPSRMMVLLPLQHLSPSHPPALSENQSLLKSSLFKTSLCSTSSVTGIKRSFQTHHLFIFSFR